MRDIARSLLASTLGFVGVWLLEWRNRLEGEEYKVGGTSVDD